MNIKKKYLQGTLAHNSLHFTGHLPVTNLDPHHHQRRTKSQNHFKACLKSFSTIIPFPTVCEQNGNRAAYPQTISVFLVCRVVDVCVCLRLLGVDSAVLHRTHCSFGPAAAAAASAASPTAE
jgi:hypothetical protein